MADDAPAPCEHDYAYTGVRFKDGLENRPGSGAKDRYYAHVFHCRKCLDVRSEQIGAEGNTYEEVRYGATPAAGGEVEVPQPWRRW